MKKARFIPLIFFIPILANTIHAHQRPDQEIVFGMSGSLGGHFGYYGNAIKHGIEAYFNRVNNAGGIKGKKLRLVAVNDNGNPEKTVKNVQEMTNQKIDMFIGIMGTRGMLSLIPLIQEKKIALFFPWGSHKLLKNPALSAIINGPGDLGPQIQTITQYITKTLAINHIGIFHADADFSTEGADLLEMSLKKENITIAAHEEYNRLTLDIFNPTQRLIEKSPRLVVSISTSMPTVKMINQFFSAGCFDVIFLGTEGTFLTPKILKPRNIKFKFVSPVPDPTTSTITIAQNYKQDMSTYFPNDDLNILSFMYYLSAAALGRAIENCQGTINKEKIIKEIENFKKFNLDGFTLDFNNNDRFLYGKEVWII